MLLVLAGALASAQRFPPGYVRAHPATNTGMYSVEPFTSAGSPGASWTTSTVAARASQA
jgi:hypothetical protein